MEYLIEKFRLLTKNIFITRIEENKGRELSRYEVYLEHIYRILSWESTTLTLVVFLILNFIFWVIAQWQLKFYGVFFFTILLGFLWDTYFETKECTVYREQYSYTVDEICCFLYDIFRNFKDLRKESPSSFFLGMCIIFLFMAFIGRNVSGGVLIYLMILGIFFIPLAIKYLPDEYVIRVKQILKSLGTSTGDAENNYSTGNMLRLALHYIGISIGVATSFIETKYQTPTPVSRLFCTHQSAKYQHSDERETGVLAEEELIPFIFNKDFSRKDTDLDSLLTDRTADSVTNSMASGISAMPSYLDVMDSQNGIEEDDLLPKNMTQDGISYTPGELSSDSDSDHRGIEFDSAHFNGDSSSEEEHIHIKGLKFSLLDTYDLPQKKGTVEAGLAGVLNNFAAMGGTLVSNVLKSAVSNAPISRKDSSDSEFEIIDSEDIQDS